VRSNLTRTQQPSGGRSKAAAELADRNASQAMARLLATPLPLSPGPLDCGTQLTRRWTRDGFNGYAPGMAGHLIATYHGREQHCSWSLENRRLEDRLRPGTVTVVADSHDGQWTLAGPIEVSHVYLTNDRLRTCAELIAGGQRVELLDRLGFDDRVSARILEILSDDDVVGDPGARLLIEQSLDLLCTQLLRRHCAFTMNPAGARRGLAEWQVKRVTAFMREHLDRPIGLEELAALVGLSRFHFCTAFRLATGRTPHLWLTEQRIERARALLGNPELHVSDIALAVGYATPSAFTASFRRIVGLTPSEYRRRL
jgi:AraC family transcriptional regulator